jgi:hypothetical protein
VARCSYDLPAIYCSPDPHQPPLASGPLLIHYNRRRFFRGSPIVHGTAIGSCIFTLPDRGRAERYSASFAAETR